MRRLSVLAEVADTVTEQLSLDHQLPRMIALITEVFDAERATLFLLDPDTGELFSRVAAGDGMREIRIPATAGIAGAVFRLGQGRDHRRRLQGRALQPGGGPADRLSSLATSCACRCATATAR